MANEQRVGGTSSCSKLPDMESLPPMEAHSSCSWASSAPRRAAAGRPHRLGSVRVRGKYSWKESQQGLAVPPAATTLATDSTTAHMAP